MRRFAEESLEDLKRVLQGVKTAELRTFARELLLAERIFVFGLGRTGLMARGFAMRLMHLGRRVFHVGDVITPAIGKADLLVIATRTGRSKVLGHYTRIAKRARARVAVVTADARSPATRGAHAVLAIDDRRALRARRQRGRRLPLGSLFEQALLVVLDQVVLDLMEALHLGESDLAGLHTTFE